MKNMLSFLFFSFVVLFCNNLFANSDFSVVHNFENKEQSKNHDLGLSIRNQNISSNIFVQAYPEPQIKNWGIKQNTSYFNFSVGNISFSGIKNRLNNPLWTKINPLRIFSVPKLFLTTQLPNTISNSENYSMFLKFNPKFENRIFGIIENIDFSATWTPEENGGLVLTSLIIPFQFEKTKINLSSSFASNFIQNNDTSWYLESQYFDNQRINKFLQEINFLTKNVCLYSAWEFSSDPFEKIKFYTRNDLTLNFNITKKSKYETEARFFYSQNDFITLSGKILKQPLSFAILPKFTFNTGTSNLIFAFGYDYALSYSKGKEQVKSVEDCYQLAFKMEFLYWNFTSKASFIPTEQNFEFYNSAFFHFFATNKFSLSDSLWIKFVSSKLAEETELSLGTKLITNINTDFGMINNELSSKILTDLKNDNMNLSCKIKFSWNTLWISGNFTDIEINFSNQNTKKSDSPKGITFEISSGFTVKF